MNARADLRIWDHRARHEIGARVAGKVVATDAIVGLL